MIRLVLKEVLKKKGVSKREFSRRINKAYPTVFRYFRQGYDPTLSQLNDWARALGVKVRDLFRE